MAQDAALKTQTKADFFAFIATEPEGRFEFENGRIIDMSGGTESHSDIATRFVLVIGRQYDEARYRLYGPDRGVETEKSVRYPDVVVTGLPVDPKSRWTQRPVLIVEVLSDDSQKRDRVTKPAEYAILETLQAYVVADPDEPTCYVWLRSSVGGFPSEPATISGATGVIDIPHLGLSLRLADIYRAQFGASG